MSPAAHPTIESTIEPPGLHALLRQVRRPERARVVLAIGLGALTSTAGTALLGLSGWFLAACAMAGVAGPVAAIAFNTLLPSAAIRLAAITRTAGRYGERLAGHDAGLRSLARLRPAIFGHLAGTRVADALGHDPGETASRLVEDVDEIGDHLIRRLAWPSACGGVAAGMAGLWLAAGWRAAAAVLALIALELALAGWLSVRRARLHAGLPAALGALRATALRICRATAELRAYGLEAKAAAELSVPAGEVVALQQRIARQAGLLSALRAAGAIACAMTALWCAADAGPALAALAALAGLASSEAACAPLAGLERRGPLLRAAARIDALLRRRSVPPAGPVQPARSLTVSGQQIAPGRIVALRGASGAGKTTLIEMLLGFRRVPRGLIRLGSADLADLPVATARGAFSPALQSAPVLSGTIRDNLRLASPMADDGAMMDALDAVSLGERVRAMQAGLDTWLAGHGSGAGGVRLSAGEARRLGLARALLRPAPWLLLDEPTEGLDAKTELQVVCRLRAHLRRSGQGAIVVSHRPLPLSLCDGSIDVPLCDGSISGPARS